ncbi:MAG: cytochrome c [Polyangiaceae bacterium]|nr:cytochrome c [Polyangiaceae bacterium]
MKPTLRVLGPLILAATACESSTAAPREWTPADHTHTTSGGQVTGAPPASGSPMATLGLDDVTIVTWRGQCVRCHGTIGMGDGPEAPMTRPPDLTDPAWQRSVKDDAIVQVIRAGRGKMPPFTALPEGTLRGLVRLVRLLDASRDVPGAPARAGAPSSSARPPASGAAPAPPAGAQAGSAGVAPRALASGAPLPPAVGSAQR